MTLAEADSWRHSSTSHYRAKKVCEIKSHLLFIPRVSKSLTLTKQCALLSIMQELVNSLKTDRTLLSLAVALLYNCCLSGADKTGVGSFAAATGNDRLSQVAGDRAFCCLLMKVIFLSRNRLSKYRRLLRLDHSAYCTRHTTLCARGRTLVFSSTAKSHGERGECVRSSQPQYPVYIY